MLRNHVAHRASQTSASSVPRHAWQVHRTVFHLWNHSDSRTCSEDTETIEGLVVRAIWPADRRNKTLEMVEIRLAFDVSRE